MVISHVMQNARFEHALTQLHRERTGKLKIFGEPVDRLNAGEALGIGLEQIAP